MPRPPIKAAHQAATKALVVKYNAEWLWRMKKPEDV